MKYGRLSVLFLMFAAVPLWPAGTAAAATERPLAAEDTAVRAPAAETIVPAGTPGISPTAETAAVETMPDVVDDNLRQPAADNGEFEPLPAAEDKNSEFFNPDEQLGAVKTLEKPDCASAGLYAKTYAAVKQYTDNLPAVSILAKRRKALIVENIGSFEQVSPENFSPETDFNTANALITIKFNKKVKSKDILLCRQKGDAVLPLYLIAYPYADNYKVHIINLDRANDDYEAVTFIYP